MDTYSKTRAAKLLGVSRQTVYRYIKNDPDRFTITDDTGEQAITLRGLEELRAAIHGNSTRYTVTDTTELPLATSDVSLLRQELNAERERTKAALDDVARMDSTVTTLRQHAANLQEKITSLENQNSASSRRIESLESEKTLLYGLLGELQKKIPDQVAPEQIKAGLFARVKLFLMGSKEPVKPVGAEPIQGEQLHNEPLQGGSNVE